MKIYKTVFLCWILCPACQQPETSVKPGINDRFKSDVVVVGDWIDRFEAESREVYHQRDAIVDAMNLRTGETVADIGAGTGFYSFEFANRVGPDGVVYAVDIADAFVAHIDEQARMKNLPNIRAIQCTDRDVGLPHRSIDAAIICDTYHHFEYPRSTLRSLHRAMRPGGRVYVVDFVRHEPDGGLDDPKWTALSAARRSWIAGHVRCDRATVIEEFRAAGFKLADSQPARANELLTENYVLAFTE